MKTKETALNLMTALATACAVVVTGITIYRQIHPSPLVGQVAREDRPVPDWSSHVAAGRRIGSSSAAVTLVEFGDFQCPACAAFFRVAEQVRRNHPDDVSIVFRHFPLSYHAQAYPSSRAAECAANQGQFEGMYRALYSARDSLGQVPYRNLAQRAGVKDLSAFETCFADTARVARIETDLKAGDALKIAGTPAIILSGKLLASIPTADELEKAIRAAKSGR